jgi:hypothetical protein
MENIHVSHEKGGILLLTFKGEINNSSDIDSLRGDIAVVSKAIKDLHKSEGKGIKVLIDITNFTAEYVSEAIEALAELAKSDKALVYKTGVFGGSMAVRALGEVIIALSGRGNIQFFEKKEEAINWVNAQS